MTTPTPADPVDLEFIEGEPYNREFRVVDGAVLWPEHQVWAQVRSGPGSSLIADLTPNLTVITEDGSNDLLIYLNLSGADTRRIRHAALWDLYISELGPDQDTGRRLVKGAVRVDRAITTGPPA